MPSVLWVYLISMRRVFLLLGGAKPNHWNRLIAVINHTQDNMIVWANVRLGSFWLGLLIGQKNQIMPVSE